jgi:ABC-2 type transport system permease protein
MLSIFQKEVNQFLNSLLGYMVLIVFLIATGLLFWVFPQNSVLDYGFAEMGSFFSVTPFVFIFLIPAITMRSFAEEKKSGTLEWLLTKPVSEFEILMGKFLAAWTLSLMALIPTLIYFISLYLLGSPQGNIDSAGVAGSYLGLSLLSLVFSSVGIFGSLLSENQLVAFVISVFLCFFFYSGLSSAAAIDVWAEASLVLGYLSLDSHYQALGKGLIDLRDVVFFLSFSGILLLSGKLILGSRRWS